MEPGGKGPEINRRQFLRFLVGGAVAAAIPSSLEAGIKITPVPGEKQPAEIPTLPEVSIADQIVVEGRKNPETNVEVTPEYDRFLEHLLLTVPSTPEKGAGSYLSLEQMYGDLLAALPAYTKIDATVERKGEANLIALLNQTDKLDQTKIYHPALWTKPVESWSQDLGEVVSIAGQQKFIIPMDFKKKFKETRNRLKSRNKVLRATFPRREVIQADFTYEGGNMTFDMIDGQLVVFIGYNDIVHTQENYTAEGKTISPQAVAEKISKTFGDAKVVVMGNDYQAPYQFHIDQSFIILADQQVVMNKYIMDKDQYLNAQWVKHQTQQEYYKKQLLALGYTITELEVPINEASQFHASINAVPYMDKETGMRKIIFPTFPDDIEGNFSNTAPQLENIQGQALQAYRTFQSLGYQPVPVRDTCFRAKGNTHCITNVLAYLEQHPDALAEEA